MADKSFRAAFKNLTKHSDKDAKKIVQNDPAYKSMDKKKNKKEAKRNRG